MPRLKNLSVSVADVWLVTPVPARWRAGAPGRGQRGAGPRRRACTSYRQTGLTTVSAGSCAPSLELVGHSSTKSKVGRVGRGRFPGCPAGGRYGEGDDEDVAVPEFGT